MNKPNPPATSLQRLIISIARTVREDLGSHDSSSELVPSVDRVVLTEARAGEQRLAYLRALVVAPYLVITLWTLVRRPEGTSAAPLIPAVVLGSVWVAGAIILALALRRGWYDRSVAHAAPVTDAGAILAGFLLWWRLDEPAWRVAPAEVVGYVTALCAFLSLSGALRLSQWSARAGTMLGVAVFLIAAATAGMDALLAAAIALTLFATGMLSASVTTLVRRVVTDEVARAALTRMYEKAEETIDAREQVLKIVSHDLRNPLHTISMSAALLMEIPQSPDQQAEHLKRIRRAGDRMNRLIQDLMDAAKLEAGRVAIDARSIPAAPIIGEAHEMLGPLAGDKGIRFEVGVADDLPDITADSGRILQVLSNLVGNAIKFTPSGGRIIVRADSAPGGVQFSVRDTGHGISAEQLGKIFQRFWMADPADRRGIGLGLAIAKGIVEAHGSTLYVESQVGVGTMFYFTIKTVLPPAASGARERRKDGEPQPA